MSNIYQFDNESHDDLKRKTFDDFPELSEDNTLKKDLKHFIKSVRDLIAGKQGGKLNKRGFVLLVSGTWGAGKSTATWIAINEVKKKIDDSKNKCSIEIIDTSLLPFGSAGESITTFLNSLAQILWDKGILDIRSDIKQFILEITPDADPSYHLSAAIGPLSFSKPINKTQISVSRESLLKKFSRLVNSKNTILIVLDDLDRLRPNEIIDVLRMVEKLRLLPRVILILPVYKQVITDAFQKDLNLSSANAATFLRKLSDAEVFIDNSIEDLKRTFLECFIADTNNQFGVISDQFDLALSEFCWYVLLHCLVFSEAIEQMRDPSNANPQGENLARAFDPQISEYLSDFRSKLIKSVETNNPSPFPVHSENGQGGDIFIPLGNYYRDIRELNNNTPNRMATFLRYDDVNKLVTTENTIVAKLGEQPNGAHQFDQGAQDRSSSSIFKEVLLPSLQNSKVEAHLTDNYKLRDIKILAQMIQGDRRFEVTDDTPRNLFEIIAENYRKFRF